MPDGHFFFTSIWETAPRQCLNRGHPFKTGWLEEDWGSSQSDFFTTGAISWLQLQTFNWWLYVLITTKASRKLPPPSLQRTLISHVKFWPDESKLDRRWSRWICDILDWKSHQSSCLVRLYWVITAKKVWIPRFWEREETRPTISLQRMIFYMTFTWH